MQISDQGSTLALSGEITLTTLTREHYRAWETACRRADLACISWDNVTRADSAAVCLLLAALRSTQAHQGTLKHHGISPELMALLQLYEIDSWII